MEEGLVTKDNFQGYLEGPSRFEEDMTPNQLFACQTLAAEFIPRGWKVAEDVTPDEFDVSDLEFISFLEEGESYVNSDTMRKRAVCFKANLGLSDGKRILAEQDKIPDEMRGKCIVLPGTVLRNPDGRLLVAYLDWDGDSWGVVFYWLGSGWTGGDRFARCK